MVNFYYSSNYVTKIIDLNWQKQLYDFDYEAVCSFYDAIHKDNRSCSIKNTVRSLDYYKLRKDSKHFHVSTQPIGMSGVKGHVGESLEEFKKAFYDILLAVESMHVHHFYHSDVRWPNVIWYVDQSRNSQYLLIDFENVKRLCNKREECDHQGGLETIDLSKIQNEFKKIQEMINVDCNKTTPLENLIYNHKKFFDDLKKYLDFSKLNKISKRIYETKMKALYNHLKYS